MGLLVDGSENKIGAEGSAPPTPFLFEYYWWSYCGFLRSDESGDRCNSNT